MIARDAYSLYKCGRPHLRPEIGMSSSMSGDGKRGVAAWPKLPRPASTLPIFMTDCPPIHDPADNGQNVPKN
jgi:hypothetical protein